MTDVADVEHVKFQLALQWEQANAEVKKAFETLFTDFPGDVMSALTGGQVSDVRGTASIDAWLGSTPSTLGAIGRRPYPEVSASPTWAPHHPSKNEDVVITWQEHNNGTDLGPYTDLVEVYLNDEDGEEKLKEIRIDCDKLGGHESETVERSVTISSPRDGQLRLAITVNDGGSTYPATSNEQGFQFVTGVNIQVGGADDRPSHGDHQSGFDVSAAITAIQQASQSLSLFLENNDGGELAGQQFGAGLYLLSYVSEAFPFRTRGLRDLKDVTLWLYDEGARYYAQGSFNRMFVPARKNDPGGLSLKTTQDLAFNILNLYGSLTTQIGVLQRDPDLAAAQISTSLRTVQSLIANA